MAVRVLENNMHLVRYWLEFEKAPTFSPLRLGCGITAENLDDMHHILRDVVFKGNAVPGISKCIENVDVSALDANHVLPNIGAVHRRGVWFPNIN